MSINLNHYMGTVYIHDPNDTHSIVWFNRYDNYSLILGESIRVIGVDLLGGDEI